MAPPSTSSEWGACKSGARAARNVTASVARDVWNESLFS
jgi:hypothetical protein